MDRGGQEGPISTPSASIASRLTLKDGRTLVYDQYGDPNGRPLFYFHSLPGSRLLGQWFVPAAEELGVRVIAADRPGIGGSQFKSDRSIADWPDDVIELADSLGIGRFSVVGTSGGGPFALACAWKAPDRLEGVVVVSGITPPDLAMDDQAVARPFARLGRWARRAPWTIRPAMVVVGAAARRSDDRLLDRLSSSSAPVDQQVLGRPDARAVITAAGAEAFRSGSRGVAWEMRLTSSRWPFELDAIAAEVNLWQGEQDSTVSPDAARRMAAAIPRCRAHFIPDAGHLWAVDHMAEVLKDLFEPTPLSDLPAG